MSPRKGRAIENAGARKLRNRGVGGEKKEKKSMTRRSCKDNLSVLANKSIIMCAVSMGTYQLYICIKKSRLLISLLIISIVHKIYHRYKIISNLNSNYYSKYQDTFERSFAFENIKVGQQKEK